jgi:prophage regulatory protein
MSAEIAIDTNVNIPTDGLLRLEQVMSLTSLCRSHVFLLTKKGQFPSSITIGVRGARWSEREVRQWIANQIATARKAPASTPSSVGNEPWPSL